MTVRVIDVDRVDRVSAAAAAVPFGRTVLTALAGVLYLLGYGTARVAGAVWLGLVWAYTAVALGWHDARTRAAPDAR